MEYSGIVKIYEIGKILTGVSPIYSGSFLPSILKITESKACFWAQPELTIC